MATHGRKLIALLVLLLLQCLIAASLQSEAQVEQIIQESDDRFSDKLVQESYDAGTEAQLKVERDAAEGSIDNREDKEIALLKDIDVLLDGLASHVQEEKDSATDQAKIERAANGENKKLENAASAKQQKDSMDILYAAVKATTLANAKARSAHVAAEGRLAEATGEKHSADKQLLSAKATLLAGVDKAAKEEKACRKDSSTQWDRISAAIDNQVARDLAYLNEGRQIVKEVSDFLQKLTDGRGAGEGSRYVTGTALTQQKAMSLLSVKQRVQLKGLMNSKYVAEDRGSKGTSNIKMLLKIISRSIDDEEKAVLAKAKQDKESAQTNLSAEQSASTQATKLITKFLEDMGEKATTRQSLADSEFELATSSEALLRTAEVKADEAQKAAEGDLETLTEVVQKRRDDRDDAEQTRFGTEDDRITTKLEGAHKYLSGELTTISDIRLLITAHVGAAGKAFLQVTQRLTTYLMQTHTGSQYVVDLSKHSDTSGSIRQVLDALQEKARQDKGAADASKVELDAQNVAMRNGLKSKADGRLQTIKDEQQRLVDAAQSDHDDKLVVLKSAMLTLAGARSAKKEQKLALSIATATLEREEVLLREAKIDAELAADKTAIQEVGFATSKRNSSFKYLDDEADVVQTIREVLKGFNKPVGDLLQNESLNASQHLKLQQLLQMAGKYQGSSHTQKSKIASLLNEIETTIRNEKRKAGSTFDSDMKDIEGDKTSAYASAKRSFDSAYGALVDAVNKEQKEYDRLETVIERRVKEQKAAQSNSDAASGTLSSALETQQIQVKLANTAHGQDYVQADIFFNERAPIIRDETTAEKRRLDDTIAVVGKIRNLLQKMNFTSSLLQYDENRKTLRTSDTKSEATSALTLIDSMIDKLSDESTRCTLEEEKDIRESNLEQEASDRRAKTHRDTELKKLKDFVDAAEEAQTKATNALVQAAKAMKASEAEATKATIVRSGLENTIKGNIGDFKADFKALQAVSLCGVISQTDGEVTIAQQKEQQAIAALAQPKADFQNKSEEKKNTADAAQKAKATQTTYSKIIHGDYDDAVKVNKADSVDASDVFSAKHDECQMFITEEKRLLSAVRVEVEAKIALKPVSKTNLMQTAIHAVSNSLQKIASKNKFTYNETQTESFKYQSTGDYATKGTTKDYHDSVKQLKTLIANIRRKNKQEKDDVDQLFLKEKGEIETEQLTANKQAKKTYDNTVEQLQATVDTAQGERDIAEKSRDTQEKISMQAQSDFSSKDSTLKAAKLLQSQEVSSCKGVRDNEVAAARSAFISEKDMYDDLLKEGSALLDKEVILLDQIKSALSGDGFSLAHKVVHSKVDYCIEEKNKWNQATEKLRQLEKGCTQANFKRAGDVQASDSENAACVQLPSEKGASDKAKSAYQACISQPVSLLSVSEAQTALVQLHSKYIGKDFDYEAAKGALVQQLKTIASKLKSERTALSSQHKADVEASTKKRDDEIERAEGISSDCITRHQQLVEAAQGPWDTASELLRKQQSEYTRLVGIKNVKQGVLNQAFVIKQEQETLADGVRKNEERQATIRYNAQVGRIQNLREIDIGYIEAELRTLDTLDSILVELGITEEVITEVVHDCNQRHDCKN